MLARLARELRGDIYNYLSYEMAGTKCTAAIEWYRGGVKSSKSLEIIITAPLMAIQFHNANIRDEPELCSPAGINLYWARDSEHTDNADAYTLQIQAKVSGIKNRCRSYYGLVIVPTDDTKLRWQRVGRYTLRIRGLKAWSYGDERGQRSRITLI